MLSRTVVVLVLQLTALAAWPQAVSAQEVRGLVLQADGATPAPAVLVQLVETGGTLQGRTVTSSAGRFQLRVPAPGRYRIRALRIGFRPTLSDELDVPLAGIHDLHITLGAEPVTMAAIQVSGRSACRRVDGAGADVATVWEEARKALALASLTAAGRRHLLTVTTYERGLEGGIVAREDARVAQTTESRAFRSVGIDTLLREGFVVQQGDALAFFGPDADVLLSDAFVAAHCLRLVPSPDGDAAHIAIAFAPLARRDVIGVRGTLTLVRETSELRRLDFSYVGLPDEAAAAGGTLVFARIDDGGWVVRRWDLRLPVLDVETGGVQSRAGVPTGERVALRGMRSAGGEVVAVVRDGAEVFHSPLGQVAGRVMSADGRAGVAHARVWLAGTAHATTTDADGTFRLEGVLPARYRLRAATPLLDSLGGVAPGGVADLTMGDVTDRVITLGTPESVYRELCRVARDDRRGALLRVTVRNAATGAVIPGATITLRWGGVERNNRVLGRQQERVLETEDDGSAAYCGAPRNVSIRIRATAGDGASPEQEVIISPLRPFRVTEVRLVPR